MRIQSAITVALFVFSETLPFLPCKSNGILHVALSSLHSLKLIPDAQFAKLENRAGYDIDHDGMIGTTRVTDNMDDQDATTITITINRKKV
jgi:hypothetical protein